MENLNHLTDGEIITRIIALNEGLEKFWRNATGWAPIESSKLLTKSRLDWQSSLSRYLSTFLEENIKKESGALIVAWTVLGSLIEGSMKLFLSVWYESYKGEEFKEDIKAIRKKDGSLIEPDVLMLEKLKVFFAERVFPKWVRIHWVEQGEIDLIEWITMVQQKRNAVHAFQDRDIGNFDLFFQELRIYLLFLRKINASLPYPDDEYEPKET